MEISFSIIGEDTKPLVQSIRYSSEFSAGTVGKLNLLEAWENDTFHYDLLCEDED